MSRRLVSVAAALLLAVAAAALPGVAAAALPGVVVAGAAHAPPVPAARALPVRQNQWYLDALRIPDIQKVTQGEGVTVGLIDDGVDSTHPDLTGQILPGQGFGPGYSGYDGMTDIRGTGHGTAMAGIIAAKGGGPTHALGIAPKAKILAVPLPKNAGYDAIAQAIRYCVDHGAKVINISYGGGFDQPPSIYSAVRYALDHDVVIASAAGDITDVQPQNQVEVPALVPGVLAVGSILKNGSHDPTTVTGPEMALAAPGEDIWAPATGSRFPDGYAVGGQTSSASAIVSGVAALIRSKYPQLDAKNVINRLIRTASGGGQARNATVGFGEVNAYNAVLGNVPTVNDWPLPIPPAAGSTAQAGGSTDGSARGNAPAWLLPVLALLCLGLVAAAITIPLVVSSRRRAARARAAVGAGYGPPYAGAPPSQYGPPGQQQYPQQQPGPPRP
jgi:subtilisin family serine protease